MNPASVRLSETSCADAGTEATKESEPVVLVDPLAPPAICWLILVMATGTEVLPTLSAAETPVAALSSPESSVACVIESVKATSLCFVPATQSPPLGDGTDWGHETGVTTAVKS